MTSESWRDPDGGCRYCAMPRWGSKHTSGCLMLATKLSTAQREAVVKKYRARSVKVRDGKVLVVAERAGSPLVEREIGTVAEILAGLA